MSTYMLHGHDDRKIEITSAKIQHVVGLPPVIRWRHNGTQCMQIESYLYMPPSGITFPQLPMHMLGILLDGRTVQNVRNPKREHTSGGEEENFTTAPNRCALVPKDIASHWRASHGSVTMALIYLPGAAQHTLHALIYDSDQPVFLHDGLLVSLIRQLLKAAVTGNNGSPDYEARLVSAFVAHLDWLAAAQKANRNLDRRSTLTDFAITNALRLIDRHLAESITTEWLCRSIQMAPTTFRQRFQAVTGLPVHRYVLVRRVERARELIEESNLALSLIASQCGFSSQSHMTLVIKRELGVTPGELRSPLSPSRPHAKRKELSA